MVESMIWADCVLLHQTIPKYFHLHASQFVRASFPGMSYLVPPNILCSPLPKTPSKSPNPKSMCVNKEEKGAVWCLTLTSSKPHVSWSSGRPSLSNKWTKSLYNPQSSWFIKFIDIYHANRFHSDLYNSDCNSTEGEKLINNTGRF